MNQSEVAQYLASNPYFFEEHAELLGTIKLSSPLLGRAVSLQERQMEVVRDKYRHLELRLSELMRLAQENDNAIAKFQKWANSLLMARNDVDLPHILTANLKDIFNLPHASLRLWNVAEDFEHTWFAAPTSDTIHLFANGLTAPFCGENKDFEAATWLDVPVSSIAMMPLKAEGKVVGLLVLGSTDKTRFSSNMATDFLSQLADTASAAISCLIDSTMSLPEEAAPALHPDCLSFLDHLRHIRKYSPHTISSYRQDLISLSQLFASTPPASVSAMQIRKLTNQLHSQQLQPRTIARHLSCWRGFFAWLSNHTEVANNPVQGIKAPKRSKSLPKALSVDEAVHLVGQPLGDSVAQMVDHAMFELLYSSGLRVSELVNLDVAYCREKDYTSTGWIDLTERIVHVTGKGSKTREVPIGEAAATALNLWIALRPQLVKTDEYALFLTNRGTRMSPRLVQMRIKAHAKKMEIKSNVHPHVLRHSFASHVLQSSGDLRAVQELLGHASLTSTQVYTALDFQHLSQTYDAAHPRAKIK